MADCVQYVNEAKVSCFDARDKSKSLIDKSRSVQDKLQVIGKVNRESFNVIRELSQSNEIADAIELAGNMDDLVLDCASKCTSMIDRVCEGFSNLPPIITDGMNMQEVGKSDDDPQPVGVEKDIEELDKSRDAIEKADILTTFRSATNGFDAVSTKSEMCRDLFSTVEGFATNCDGTIQAFMGVWDFGSANEKIVDMCRLVSLGELMRQFADQIKQLILAILAFLKAAKDKLFSFDITDLANFDGLSERIDDKLDNVKEQFGKLGKFFKK
jgi:hypothetical protein